MKVLDLGCGNRKRNGAIGIDINPATSADVVYDLNTFPYPFADSFFDEIYADNILEHLDDVIKVMEELYRIGKPDSTVTIIVPYFRARWAFIDPTLKHFFSVESFSYFDPEHVHHRLFNYSQAKFKVEKIVFNENIRHVGALRIYYGILKMLANHFPTHYEVYLGNILPLDDLTFHLRTIK